MLEEIKKEVEETTMLVRSDLVSQHNNTKRKIQIIEIEKDQPARSEEDLNGVRSARKQLEEELQSLSQKLEEEEGKPTHKKIMMFKQVR